jgi:hypothetical protein
MRRSRDTLGQHLVRKSVDRLAEQRDVCTGCGRTPLTGERVQRYEDGRLVCELCRPLRRVTDTRNGAHDEVVRHSEYGHTVRLVSRAAA